jgi:hypothetical protein
MKNTSVENLQVAAVLLILFLFFAAFVAAMHWFIPRYIEPKTLLVKRDLHSIYCVEDTAFILLPSGAVIAPPHFTHHSTCAVLASFQKDKK